MFFLLFVFILFLNCSASETGEFQKIFDQSTITFSLKNYNVSNPDGESIELYYSLPPYSTHKIIVTNVPDDAHFVMVQVHGYLANITLSYEKVSQMSTSVTGTNIGLLQIYQGSNIIFYLMYNSSEDADIMVATQAYGIGAPIPGGCNMEFQVEISPFLKTTYNDAITEVDFAPSSPPMSVLPNPLIYPSNECNVKLFPVQHKMYHQYFPERDFSKDTYFRVLKSMMTKSRILKNGKSVKEKLTGSLVRRIFASYPGTGNAFVVISQFNNQTAVYVPSFTYACSDLMDNNTCLVLTTTFSKVLCASILFMGLFACFVGHYFFKTEIFLFGFLVSGIVIYILVSILFSNIFALSTAVSLGLFIATLKLIAWAIFGLPIISVTLATLTFGFLLSSIIFFGITDLVELLVLDINFWGIFIGIVIACPILMLSLAEKANIIACAFLGSYVAVTSIDHYIGTNLRYIVLNTIRRATVEKFRLATIDPPFQLKDVVLCFAWAFLLVSGIIVQMKLMKNRPPYPPPVNPVKKIWERLRSPTTNTRRASERTPLLRDAPSNGGSTYACCVIYDGN